MHISLQIQYSLRRSSEEMHRTRTLIVLAMFMALSIVTASFKIRTPYFSVTPSAIVKMYVAMLYGPVAGACFGFARDILQFFIANTGDAFFPGYTLTETLGMFLYGLFFYRRPLRFSTVLIGKLAVVLICNILLGTLWLSLMSGKAFLFYLPARAAKNAVTWIVDSVVFYLLARALSKTGFPQRLQ